MTDGRLPATCARDSWQVLALALVLVVTVVMMGAAVRRGGARAGEMSSSLCGGRSLYGIRDGRGGDERALASGGRKRV